MNMSNIVQGTEIGIINTLAEKGPLGIVVVFACLCGWLSWKKAAKNTLLDPNSTAQAKLAALQTLVTALS